MLGYLVHLSGRLNRGLSRGYEPDEIKQYVDRGMRHVYQNNLHVHPIDEYTQEFLAYATAAGIAIDDPYIWSRCINLLAGRKVPLCATTVHHALVDHIVNTVVDPCYFEEEAA